MEIQDTTPKCYVGHTSVWMAQDTTVSRVPRLNVDTNQILVVAPLIPLRLE